MSRIEPDPILPFEEWCDLCGLPVGDGVRLYALVVDFSGSQNPNPALGQRRLVTACSEEHLTQLQDQYRRPLPPA